MLKELWKALYFRSDDPKYLFLIPWSRGSTMLAKTIGFQHEAWNRYAAILGITAGPVKFWTGFYSSTVIPSTQSWEEIKPRPWKIQVYILVRMGSLNSTGRDTTRYPPTVKKIIRPNVRKQPLHQLMSGFSAQNRRLCLRRSHVYYLAPISVRGAYLIQTRPPEEAV